MKPDIVAAGAELARRTRQPGGLSAAAVADVASIAAGALKRTPTTTKNGAGPQARHRNTTDDRPSPKEKVNADCT